MEWLKGRAGVNDVVPPLPDWRREMEQQIRLKHLAAFYMDNNGFSLATNARVDVGIFVEGAAMPMPQ